MPSRPDRRRPGAVALAVLALLLAGVVAPSPPASAVVGGRPADPGEWPWQVALLYLGQQFCGGTLVSPSHVLTAAHCTDQFEAGDIEVLAGTVDLASGGERRAVATIAEHEQWDDYNLRFDIALIELAAPFELGDTIGLASLATDAQVEELAGVGSPLVVTGFGATGELELGSPVLLEGEIEAVDDTQCLDVYREFGMAVYAETQICAADPAGGVGSCYGDSGGPLVAPLDAERTRWVQVGVVSWGGGCARAGNPTVYTEVWAFVEWLAARGVPLAVGQEFSGSGARIPAVGTVGKAATYPLAMDVQGFEGTVSTVSLRLGLTHSRASDLDIRLVAPDGTTITVLSDAGGDERFDQTEVLVLQTAGARGPGAAVGTIVGPTDHEPDPQWLSEPAPADLGALAGIDPNGRWELLVADDQQGAMGRLSSWTLVLG
jgi:secreted trypsin-like serine protease